jgi:CNT family concentrative nucleoside transporter
MSEWDGATALVVLTAIAWTLSEDRAAVRWRIPLVGFTLQFGIALVMLKLPQSRILFARLNDGVVALQSATESGRSFVFGYLGGAPPPFEQAQIGGFAALVPDDARR